MLVIILLSCLTRMGSGVPVLPSDPNPQISHGGTPQSLTVEPAGVTNPQPEALTPSPQLEQLQPGVPFQPGAQSQAKTQGQTQAHGGPQFLSPAPFFTWYPLGGSPMFFPLQSGVQEFALNQMPVPQQPLIFSPFRYFPLFTPSYMNPPFPSYELHMNPQTLTNQPQNSVLLPAVTPSVNAPQQIQQQQQQLPQQQEQLPQQREQLPQPPQQQQQQTPQVVYMLQQTMNIPVGSLSSEELAMAASTGQLGVYLTSVLTNPSAEAVQPLNQAAGLKHTELPKSAVPTVATSSAQASVTQGLQQNTNALPAGLEGATQKAATVQTPVQAELKPTQEKRI